MPKETEYLGVENVTTLEQRQALDGLVVLLGELADHRGEGKKISFVGEVVCGRHFWIVEFDFTVYEGGDIRGGASIMRNQADCAAYFSAIEDYLRCFHVKAFRPPGWESDIDDKDDAEIKLRDVWKALATPASVSA